MKEARLRSKEMNSEVDVSEVAAVARLDRRKEPRRPAQGKISMVPIDSPETVIEGSLVDVSASGFRVACPSRSLRTGLEIMATYAGRRVRARIVWTRALGDRFEAGCVLLDS
jgi:hypothetical protein